MDTKVKMKHGIRREVAGVGAPTEDSSVMIDVERYLSPAFAQKEWDAVFTKTWQIACREDHVRNPGDFYVFDLGVESIVIAHGSDGKIRAFYNVCKHRGNQLVRGQRTGNAASFACSYHRWTWNNTGSVKFIPDRETFPGMPDECSLGLGELKLGIWGGFVFVSMDPNVESLESYLGPLPKMLDKYEPGRMALMQDLTVEWNCNWKVGLDAFNETYHVAATHPQLLVVIDDYNVHIDCFERHNSFHVAYGVPSPRIEDRVTMPEVLGMYMDPTRAVLDGTGKDQSSSKAILEAGAVDPKSFKGSVDDVRPAVQRQKRANQDKVPCLPYKNLADAELTDDLHIMCFPNTQFNVFAENILMFRHRPHPTDPNRSFYDIWYLSHVAPGEPRSLPQHKTVSGSQADVGLTLSQDASNVESVQAGMKSRSIKAVYLSELETRIRHFNKVLDAYMRRAE
jgi:phenylpropionate dioxygenase-like ring-hydroxylating dioxygenase large terminal subunit